MGTKRRAFYPSSEAAPTPSPICQCNCSDSDGALGDWQAIANIMGREMAAGERELFTQGAAPSMILLRNGKQRERAN